MKGFITKIPFSSFVNRVFSMCKFTRWMIDPGFWTFLLKKSLIPFKHLCFAFSPYFSAGEFLSYGVQTCWTHCVSRTITRGNLKVEDKCCDSRSLCNQLYRPFPCLPSSTYVSPYPFHVLLEPHNTGPSMPSTAKALITVSWHQIFIFWQLNCFSSFLGFWFPYYYSFIISTLTDL